MYKLYYAEDTARVTFVSSKTGDELKKEALRYLKKEYSVEAWHDGVDVSEVTPEKCKVDELGYADWAPYGCEADNAMDALKQCEENNKRLDNEKEMEYKKDLEEYNRLKNKLGL